MACITGTVGCLWIDFTHPLNFVVNGSKVSQRFTKTFTKKNAPHFTLWIVHKSLVEQFSKYYQSVPELFEK